MINWFRAKHVPPLHMKKKKKKLQTLSSRTPIDLIRGSSMEMAIESLGMETIKLKKKLKHYLLYCLLIGGADGTLKACLSFKVGDQLENATAEREMFLRYCLDFVGEVNPVAIR